jgi:dihydroorotate dehydrogenase electron transfer subunit
MHNGKGMVVELILEDGQSFARISCPPALTPFAGQYLLASDASDSALPVPLFYTDSAPEGFICAPPLPESWRPGQEVYLRGPLGRGFSLPVAARKIALVAFDRQPWRLRGLIRPSLNQGGSIVLVSDVSVDHLADEVEVQPLSALSEIVEWADYIAFDIARDKLIGLRERLGGRRQATALAEAQLLIQSPMPCGGVADCGVCAVSLKSGWEMVCKEGPVFVYNKLFD